MKNDRRQFLRNTSLAAFSMMMLPKIAQSTNPNADDETSATACNPTTLDYYGQGPFYTANAPTIVGNLLAPTSASGTRLIISGRVQTIDCTKFIPNTLIDVWHADDAGAYDNVGYNLRGKTTSNAQGFYMFETIYPGKYLNGGSFRPSHIHFKITPPGFPELTTQLYFVGDPDNATDPASSITSGTYDATSRIIPLTNNSLGQLEGTWDIAINGDGVLGMPDLHRDMGMIYAASPNPFTDHIEFKYGVFRQAIVNLSVFDMQGRLVSDLGERELSPEKYIAAWNPDGFIPAGTYFIALKINDVQVHHLKVIKQ